MRGRNLGALGTAFLAIWLAACEGERPDDEPSCPPGMAECGGACVDLKRNREHCGACGVSCGEGVCIDGSCEEVCPEGTVECEGSCVDLRIDPENCGGCGVACEADRVCSEGACVCPEEMTECDGACVDTRSDPANCGACGTQCEADRVCREGACACGEGLLDCEGSCIDPLSDGQNCGACGVVCGEDRLCVDGACVLDCAEGLVVCGETCVDTSTDRLHCGACDNACVEGQDCVDGECVCVGDLEFCDGACVDTRTSVEHCGACGNACFEGQSCQEGVCRCPAFREACDGECVDTSRDVRHCGGCGIACEPRPNAQPPVCVAGECALECREGFADCDGDEVNGCEIHLPSSAQNCGACGFDCTAMDNVIVAGCSESRCLFTCATGFADCDGLDETGCESSLSSPTSCGACGNDCTSLPRVAEASCSEGGCVIDECEEGWLDCDGDPSNGCEADAMSVNSCGSCGNGCTYACGSSGCTEAERVFATLGNNACAVLRDGSLWCWGANDSGKVDSGAGDRPTPVRISLPTAVVSVAGYNHLCAALANGQVYCWGENSSGQLGDGTTTSRSTPAVVPGLNDVVAVDAGNTHTCALTEQGTVYCWGSNASGQLGTPGAANSPTPIQVPGITGAQALAAGFDFSCAVLDDATLRCWGGNAFGQLGSGAASAGEPPVDPGLTGAVSVATGFYHTCVALSTGPVQCWGYNQTGQLGAAATPPEFWSYTPITVPGVTNATKLGSGFGHTCALLQNDTVTCWGSNLFGELGKGDFGDINVGPTDLSLSNVTDIAVGWQYVCAVAEGRIHCFGQNDRGQVGTGIVGGNVTSPQQVDFP